MARFVHAPGEHRLTPGGPVVDIQPRKFGHMSMSFRGVSYELKQEGSRVILDLPDRPPQSDGRGGQLHTEPISQAEMDSLAAHGFVYEGVLAAGTVEQAVKDAAGTSALAEVLKQEKAIRESAAPAAGPEASPAQPTPMSAADAPASPPKRKTELPKAD